MSIFLWGWGSVQRSGDRVRITAQLIDALSGHHLWSERYDRVGWTHYMDLNLGSTKSPRDSFEKAIELVQKALAMDDSNPNAYCLLSSLYTYKREFAKGIAEGERAVALDPSGSIAHEIYGTSLLRAGRVKEAVPVLQKSIRLNPIGSSGAFSTLGQAYTNSGHFEEAVLAFKQVHGF